MGSSGRAEQLPDDCGGELIERVLRRVGTAHLLAIAWTEGVVSAKERAKESGAKKDKDDGEARAGRGEGGAGGEAEEDWVWEANERGREVVWRELGERLTQEESVEGLRELATCLVSHLRVCPSPFRARCNANPCQCKR